MRVKNSALPGGAFVNQEGNYLRFATGCHSCPALLGGAFWQVFVNQFPNALIDTLKSTIYDEHVFIANLSLFGCLLLAGLHDVSEARGRTDALIHDARACRNRPISCNNSNWVI